MWKKKSKTKEPENVEKAYDYAVFLLSLKLRTIGEVVHKMQDRGYTEVIIQKTIDQLKSQRFLDDERYAEVFLENLKTYKTLGFYGIQKKFMEKRLPKPLIERILKNGLPVAEEIKIAKRFLKKEGFGKSGELEVQSAELEDEHQYTTFDPESAKEKQKIANKLRTRGFRSEVVSRLIH